MEVHVTLDDDVRFPGSEWTDFAARHANWVAEHTTEHEMIYGLPIACLDKALGLYDLSRPDAEAEKQFAKLCHDYKAIGFKDEQPVQHMWLSDFDPPKRPSRQKLSEMTGHDNTVRMLKNRHVRMRAASGRVISNRQFLEEVESLKRAYLALPERQRPSFPLSRQMHLDVLTPAMETTLKLSRYAHPEFAMAFGAFCDKWALRSLIDWRLPEVDGPRWPDLLAVTNRDGRERLTMYTPWHFPLLKSDGLGKVALAEHRRQLTEHGVEDVLKWPTYASFFPLEHWQQILEQRYAKKQRTREFAMKRDEVLSHLLHVSIERVVKLRHWLRRLQSGKLRSLTGTR